MLEFLRKRIERNPLRYARFGFYCFLIIILLVSCRRDERRQGRRQVFLRIRAQNVQAEAADIDPSLISSESKGSAHSLAASLTRTQGSHSWRQIATRAASQIEHPNPAPITIALMTDHYFGAEYARKLPDCNLQGVQLDCTYFDATDETQTRETEASTATWWHAPSLCDKQKRRWIDSQTNLSLAGRGSQLSIIASMESSVNHPCLDNQIFMNNFDIKSTYKRMSDVPLLYFGSVYQSLWESQAPVQFKDKHDAVVFVQSNCQTPLKRELLVAALAQQPGIRLDSLGSCLKGPAQLPKEHGMKIEAFRQYRFCIAMENSAAEDYVTEKIYEAFAAGCIPVYYGAPNIAQFIPTKDAIIDYRDFMDPVKLAKEIRRLSGDESAYNLKLAWRIHPESWSEDFNTLVKQADSSVHPQCRVCQIIAERRAALKQS